MNQDRLAFVIRVWYEAEPDNPRLRGSVQLVSANEKIYFSSLDEIPELLRSMIAHPSNEESSEKSGDQT